MNDVEIIGREVFREVCLDPFEEAFPGVAFEIARRLLGQGSVIQARLVEDGAIACVRGRTVIAHRIGMSRPRAHFVVAQMLARMFLEKRGEAGASIETDLAAWITSPTPTFQATMAQVGVDVRALANEFSLTQTATVLRIAECGGPSSAVTTPARVYKRGRSMSWVADETIRDLVAKPNTKSVRRVQIRDEPGRTALFAKTA